MSVLICFKLKTHVQALSAAGGMSGYRASGLRIGPAYQIRPWLCEGSSGTSRAPISTRTWRAFFPPSSMPEIPAPPGTTAVDAFVPGQRAPIAE